MVPPKTTERDAQFAWMGKHDCPNEGRGGACVVPECDVCGRLDIYRSISPRLIRFACSFLDTPHPFSPGPVKQTKKYARIELCTDRAGSNTETPPPLALSYFAWLGPKPHFFAQTRYVSSSHRFSAPSLGQTSKGRGHASKNCRSQRRTLLARLGKPAACMPFGYRKKKSHIESLFYESPVCVSPSAARRLEGGLHVWACSSISLLMNKSSHNNEM